MDMKMASARLVTEDVRALARFYSAFTRHVPIGIEDYVELETVSGNLAISSKRAVGGNRQIITSAVFINT